MICKPAYLVIFVSLLISGEKPTGNISRKAQQTMKKILLALLAAALWSLGPVNITNSYAQLKPVQAVQQPVSWTFTVKKLEEEKYRIEAKAVMQAGYHIWAQDPGGDGSLIPTSFTTEHLHNGEWLGDWQESRKPKTEKIEFIDGTIRWHEKEIIFSRDFKAKRGDKIKGAVQFQSCNDEMCFPPAIENFIVSVQ